MFLILFGRLPLSSKAGEAVLPLGRICEAEAAAARLRRRSGGALGGALGSNYGGEIGLKFYEEAT